jgi:glutathione synthase
MKIAFFINDVQTEKAGYTTTHLAHEALARDHEFWYIGNDDFQYSPGDRVQARARTVSAGVKKLKDCETLLQHLQGDDAKVEMIDAEELDVLLLRSNPADEVERPWAQSVGYLFGRMLEERGVLVLNDPGTLSRAFNKLYFQSFPKEVRPETLITRNRDEVREFIASNGGKAVIKPLQGSGGTGVFLVKEDEEANLNQMMDAILRDGFLVAQEFLPAATEGDTRMVLLNGEPLLVDGQYCAYRRLTAEGDMRSNLTAGGELAKADIGERELRVAELVRPRLVEDGMFLVGLDLAGDKLMEINVFTPGGIGGAQDLTGVNFSGALFDAVEKKVEIRERHGGRFTNRQLATL